MEINIQTIDDETEFVTVTANGPKETKRLLEKVLGVEASAEDSHVTVAGIIKILQAINSQNVGQESCLGRVSAPSPKAQDFILLVENLRDGQKLLALKNIRALTHLGLKKAKDLYEDVFPGNAVVRQKRLCDESESILTSPTLLSVKAPWEKK
ncbi:hypothetical protein LCGC14_0479580 [marine sediment metagenome]|uniref:Ribosomal protein L7/L12 C-terminal domain-containing protein n=1 Tax=marine sediment metagenome TaxID=412755 RepID=A0A0F9SSV9_9ZZZZ